MKKFDDSNLIAYAHKIVIFASNGKRISEDKERALIIKTIDMLNEVGNKEFAKKQLNFIEELTNLNCLFYLKGGKDWGFCKEFLELEEIKRYKNEILNTKSHIEELNKTVEKYTKGNYKDINSFVKDAIKNRIKKIKFNLTKEYLGKNIEELIEKVKEFM